MNIPRLAGDREISGKWMVAITITSKDTGKFGMTEEQNAGTTFNYRPTGSTRNRQASP